MKIWLLTAVFTGRRLNSREATARSDHRAPTVLYLPQQASISARVGFILLVAILSVFAVAPLFYPGFFLTHSGFTPIWNVADLRANLGDLSWTPHVAGRFDPLRGDGLLPYYLAALSPLQPVTAIKLVSGLGWLLGGAGMFLWLRSWLGNGGALVAGLVYVYLPYQVITVYVRGAWGEVLFWGLLPWAILAATYLVTAPRIALLPVAAAVWLSLGLSQLGLALVAFMFIALLVIVVHRAQATLPLAVAGLGLGLAIGLYMLVGVGFLASPPTPLSDHFLYPFQLFSAHWGLGVSRVGWNDGLSLQLGLAALGLSILAVFLWQRGQAVASRADKRLIFFLAGAVILSLLQFEFTAPIWRGLGGLLTFPWQLLGLAGLCLSVLAGAALWLAPQLTRLPLLAAIVIIVVLSVYRHLQPQFIQLAPAWLNRPVAELGEAQLALLDYEFAVQTSGHTVGLDRGETSLPLSVYGPLRPNNVLLLKVTWQSLRAIDENLKVFVHLVDPNDNILAQFDGQPQEGKQPTSAWIPGDLIEDTYPLQLTADAPPGPYRVYAGFYDETTFARLPVPGDPEGRVVLNVE